LRGKLVCPKCGSDDLYYAKKLVITGVGGIYGNRARDVQRPFCRACDIEANMVYVKKDGTEVNPTVFNFKVFLWFAAVVVILGGGFLALTYVLEM
jgi:hypothetical protein